MTKQYAKEIIKLAEEAKQTLTVRKEIIIDDSITNEKLGELIRQMYKAKVDTQNESIERCKQYL